MLPADVLGYVFSGFEFEDIVVIGVVGDFGSEIVDDLVVLVYEFEIVGRAIALFPPYLVLFTLFEDECGILLARYLFGLCAHPTGRLPFEQDRGVRFDLDSILGLITDAGILVPSWWSSW
ncbi:hypothetical protein AB7C87_09575 [Natrarchaeobius sp. A-rgal3]|uniref:hypothetical protein n=1 Tax=Natrarchaeobius versutus TaxID=1679078 RepID=UPI00350FB548